MEKPYLAIKKMIYHGVFMNGYSKAAVLLSSCALALSASFAYAEEAGERTYKQVCLSCHGASVLNAPKFGDATKWAPLIAEGQLTLTAHGYVGIRGMPPQGGAPALSVEGFADALVYMVNMSGGKWKSPDVAMLTAINKEIEARKLELSKK